MIERIVGPLNPCNQNRIRFKIGRAPWILAQEINIRYVKSGHTSESLHSKFKTISKSVALLHPCKNLTWFKIHRLRIKTVLFRVEYIVRALTLRNLALGRQYDGFAWTYTSEEHDFQLISSFVISLVICFESMLALRWHNILCISNCFSYYCLNCMFIEFWLKENPKAKDCIPCFFTLSTLFPRGCFSGTSLGSLRHPSGSIFVVFGTFPDPF